MQIESHRSQLIRHVARRRPAVESLERRILLTGLLIDEGGGQLAYIEDTAGVENFISLSIGPVPGNAQIRDTGDTMFIEPAIAALGWTLSADGHTAIGPEAQLTNYYIDPNDSLDEISVTSNDLPVKIQPSVGALAGVRIGTGFAPVGAQLNTAPIFFDSQFASDGELSVDDTGDPSPHNVTVDSSTIAGLTPGLITYDHATLPYMTLIGGTGSNTTTIAESPSSFGGVAFSLKLNGNDTVNVQQLAGSSGVDITTLRSGSTDAVNIGNNGSLLGITGSVIVDGLAGLATLTIDDSADTSAVQPTIGLDMASEGSITGLSPLKSIEFNPSTLSALSVLGGTGGNTFTYDLPSGVSPNFSTFLATGSGNDTVNIVSNPVGASLHVDGGGGNDRVNIGAPGVATSGLQGSIALATWEARMRSMLTQAAGPPRRPSR